MLHREEPMAFHFWQKSSIWYMDTDSDHPIEISTPSGGRIRRNCRGTYPIQNTSCRKKMLDYLAGHLRVQSSHSRCKRSLHNSPPSSIPQIAPILAFTVLSHFYIQTRFVYPHYHPFIYPYPPLNQRPDTPY